MEFNRDDRSEWAREFFDRWQPRMLAALAEREAKRAEREAAEREKHNPQAWPVKYDPAWQEGQRGE